MMRPCGGKMSRRGIVSVCAGVVRGRSLLFVVAVCLRAAVLLPLISSRHRTLWLAFRKSAKATLREVNIIVRSKWRLGFDERIWRTMRSALAVLRRIWQWLD